MKIKSLGEYKKDPLVFCLTLPVSQALKDRYQRIGQQLAMYDKDLKIHDITRETLKDMLDKIEEKLSEAMEASAEAV